MGICSKEADGSKNVPSIGKLPDIFAHIIANNMEWGLFFEGGGIRLEIITLEPTTDTSSFLAFQVEGRLPPKPKSTVDEPIGIITTSPQEPQSNVDPETLKVATLLTKMKSSFGDNGIMQAMMLMLANKSSDSSSEASKPADQLAQMVTVAEMLNNTKSDSPAVVTPASVISQAVPGPSGYTFPAAGSAESTDKKDASPTTINSTGSSFQMRLPPKKFN